MAAELKTPMTTAQRAAAAGKLLPALLAHHRNLDQLRYDYPLVLLAGTGRDTPCFVALAGLVDEAIAGFLNAEGGDRLAQYALRVEREIRAQAAQGVSEPLPAFVERVVAGLAPAGEGPDAEAWATVAAALAQDGDVVDCDAATPAAVVTHAWRAVEAQKAQRYGRAATRLIARLEEILRADVAYSAAGRTAAQLAAGMGPEHHADFDFETMSRLLASSTPVHAVSEVRRRRIEATLAIFRSQKFFATDQPGAKPYRFVFEDCTAALEAYTAREAKALELAKAIAIAELEVDGLYKESLHDALFAEFKAESFEESDFRIFPDYLVCLNLSTLHGEEHERLSQILAAGLPMKVLVQTDDLLEEPARGGDAHLAIGWRSRQIASSAMDLHEVYVLQTTASQLYRQRDALIAGMRYDGPAVFNVYSGVGGEMPDLPAYLKAAMALESRAFPAFAYDPSAGETRAERLSIAGNPQPGVDWPVHVFQYEKPDFQRVEEKLAFTVLDFLACDMRYARHFESRPAAKWQRSAVPAAEALAGANGAEPYLLVVDRLDCVQRLVVDEAILKVAKRCREVWHGLQEAAGPRGGPVATQALEEVPAAPATAAPTAEAAPANADDPWIETERCATCNECTNINSRMFKYNKDQQAYIADPDAGTYRELVEAAEVCQVAIIHPGKPRNPNEKNLEKLIKRARPFL